MVEVYWGAEHPEDWSGSDTWVAGSFIMHSPWTEFTEEDVRQDRVWLILARNADEREQLTHLKRDDLESLYALLGKVLENWDQLAWPVPIRGPVVADTGTQEHGPPPDEPKLAAEDLPK
jgi:hypothetical protein